MGQRYLELLISERVSQSPRQPRLPVRLRVSPYAQFLEERMEQSDDLNRVLDETIRRTSKTRAASKRFEATTSV
jgi:hypothetical protein